MTHPLSYSEMVAKLAKPGADIITQMTAHQAHLLHMAVGMAGESAELEMALLAVWVDVFEQDLRDADPSVVDNAVKELGDIEFYLEGFNQGVNECLLCSGAICTGSMSPLEAMNRLSLSTRQTLDMVKKYAIYGVDLDGVELDEHIQVIHVALDRVAASLGVTRDEARARNMDKLAKRYPGFEYSNQAASARADKGAE